MPDRQGVPSPGLSLALGAAGLLVFFGVWEGCGALGLVSATFLPGPQSVFADLAHLLTHPYAGATLPEHLVASLHRYAVGVLLAALVGLPLGLAMGLFRPLDAVVTPIFDGLRFVPPIAWVPFAALWFGTGIGGPVLVIFTGAFPPVLIGTYRGARMIDPPLIEAARMLGTSHLRMLTEVLLPGAIPSIVAGLRVAAGLGWQSLIGAELIVVSSGVGYMMVQGEAAAATQTVMAGIIAVGAVGSVIDLALRTAERAVRRRYGLVGGAR
jgi:ABC-type nitrate/sulfonate/bicarbonate transport system permease component